MGLIHSLPVNVADARERWQQRLRRWQAGERCSSSDEDEANEGSLREVVVIGGGDTGETAAVGSVPMQNDQVNAAGDRDMSPRRYLPEVDTDDAIKIWCSRSQPSEAAQSGPSAWMAAEQEHSSSSGSEYDDLDDEEGDEDEEGSSEESTEMTTTSTTSTSTVPSGTLRLWRRLQKCYGDHPDVSGEMHVCRVLTYMGHPHWRKSTPPVSAAGDSPSLTTALQATMALRLEDLRQKKQQMEAAWKAMKKDAQPINRVMLEAKRQAVQQLEEELMSLHKASKKRGAREARRAKGEEGAAAESAQDQ